MRTTKLIIALMLISITSTYGATFENTSSIIIDGDASIPYPSTISVSGIANYVKSVTVTLYNVSHEFPQDIEVLLVGPGSQNVLLMASVSPTSINNMTLTFEDGTPPVPSSGAINSGTYSPTSYDSTHFGSPAPGEPYGSTLSVFNNVNPNGDWSLYVWDHSPTIANGTIAGGWSLSLSFETIQHSISYQGRLLDNNLAANGIYDMEFKVYDDPDVLRANHIGPVIEKEDVEVIDGYFVTTLDFGSDPNVFNGDARWLQIAVRLGESTYYWDYVHLSPLQTLNPTPYALYAARSDWNNLDYMPAGFADGVDDAGIDIETDPTVPADLKDGVDWTEVTNRPTGLDDGDDDTQLTELEVDAYVDNNGYLLTESDPQVGSNTTNYVPRWNGSALVTGSIFDNGNVGIGTSSLSEKLNVAGNVKISSPGSGTTANLIIHDSNGSNDRPGIQFTNNNMHYIGGDDVSNEYFGFYSQYGSTRTYDAIVNIYGKATTSWGKYLSLTHDGTDGVISTDTGDIILSPAQYVGLGTNTPSEKLEVVGSVKATDSGTSGGSISGYATDENGVAVYGKASLSGSVTNYGGYFQAYGYNGIGVYGSGSSWGSGSNYGGYFEGNGTYGVGVYGKAVGSFGKAVYGECTSTGNNTYGGYFTTQGNGSAGVYGESAGDRAVGGRFIVSGADAKGVYGESTYVGEGNYNDYGGHFRSANLMSTGVCGASSGDYGFGVEAYGTGDNGYGVYSMGIAWDYYAAGPGANYGPFTGGHEVKLDKNISESILPGMIVSVTGEVECRLDDEGEISLSSTLPTVKLADTANDKAVFGAFVKEFTLPKEHWYKVNEGERFGTVNALGEGRVWVCTINGRFELGDYITTSPVAGYGQRQDDDLLRSCTVGKVTESVDWESVGKTVEYEGQLFKVYLIAVVYTSG